MPDEKIVDTNVPIIANGRSEQAGQDCVLACVEAIERIRRCRIIVDDQWLVLREYQKQLSGSGQPGLGDAFLKWVLSNLKNPERCRIVPLLKSDRGDFEDYPSHPELAAFDPSDRKWIALALVSGAPIQQGIDHEWWGLRRVFEEVGVTVEFLCPVEIRRSAERRV